MRSPTARRSAKVQAEVPWIVRVEGTNIPFLDGLYVRVRVDEKAPNASAALIAVTRSQPYVYLKCKTGATDTGHKSDWN